ncbi:hypothetical protein GQR58_001212 [Nymphon striatum]|nr:hypothetical protein GQR58_001212 [Nymphon striatum]
MGTFCVVVGRNYSNPLRNVCCVQGFLSIQREFQFSWHPTGISVPFCASWGSQIFCGRVRLECLVHFVDVYILRCCRQKLFQSTKKHVLCTRTLLCLLLNLDGSRLRG